MLFMFGIWQSRTICRFIKALVTRVLNGTRCFHVCLIKQQPTVDACHIRLYNYMYMLRMISHSTGLDILLHK